MSSRDARSKIGFAAAGFRTEVGSAIRRVRRVDVDPRLRAAVNGTVAAGEVLIFLPLALVAVVLMNDMLGRLPTLAVFVALYALVRRPSVRALTWASAGAYIAWSLVDLGSALATQPADPVTEPARGVVSFVLSAGGLGVLLLTFGLPLVRAARRWLPEHTRIATIWLVELGRSGLAGTTIGAGLASLLPGPNPLTADESSGRVLLIGLVTAVGLVVGGLRADARVHTFTLGDPNANREP